MITISSAPAQEELKQRILESMSDLQPAVLDWNPDPFAWCLAAVKTVLEHPDHRVILLDEDGTLPFMIASKYKGIIAAQINDAHSARMTREHNNANVMCLGGDIVGPEVAVQAANRFARGEYAGGRHQIRVDMLNRMGEPL